eukprot:192369_1
MAGMQMETIKANEITIDEDTEAGQSLLNNKSSNNRRKYIVIGFILTVIITALISSLVTYFIVNDNNDEMETDVIKNYDIAIIGAGSAGLIQAHFLSKHYPNSKIIVLEQLPRFGGRQWTSFIHKIDENDNIMNSIHFENGAMRFRSYHTLTLKLMSYLNLCNDIIPISFGTNISIPSQQIYQYRNHRITGSEMNINETQTINYYSSVFNVKNANIQYLNGRDQTIWRPIFDKILLENNNGTEPVTAHDWYIFRNNYTFNGEYLYNYGDTIALKVIGNYSREIISYLYRQYEERIKNPNNLAMLLYKMFNKIQYSANNTNKTNQWTLKNGYGSMNEQLYKSLINHENANVLLNHKITAITKRQNKYLIESNFGEYHYFANKVILSIPPDKSVKLLPYSPILNTQKFRNILESVTWGDSIKINLIYDSAFWMIENLESLVPSNSDLEIREFYIENAWTNGSLTALQIYAKGKYSGFWYSAQVIGDKYPINESLKIDERYSEIPVLERHIASIVVVEEVMKQMKELTQISIPMPLAAFIHFLGYNFDTSGTTSFKTTVNADEIINESYTPIENEHIFMAISDYAWEYGWMESGISAAINNLERNFNIKSVLKNESICTFPGILHQGYS